MWTSTRVTLEPLGFGEHWVDIVTELSGRDLLDLSDAQKIKGITDPKEAYPMLNKIFSRVIVRHNLVDRDGNELAPASDGHLAEDIPLSVANFLADEFGKLAENWTKLGGNHRGNGRSASLISTSEPRRIRQK